MENERNPLICHFPKNENLCYEINSLAQRLYNALATQYVRQKKGLNRLGKLIFEHTRQPVQTMFRAEADNKLLEIQRD
jgi:hypothetical protein